MREGTTVYARRPLPTTVVSLYDFVALTMPAGTQGLVLPLPKPVSVPVVDPHYVRWAWPSPEEGRAWTSMVAQADLALTLEEVAAALLAR